MGPDGSSHSFDVTATAFLLAGAAAALGGAACAAGAPSSTASGSSAAAAAATAAGSRDAGTGAAPDPTAAARDRLVDYLAARGIGDARVLAALRAVPRHLFVPEAWRAEAYEDRALPIEEGQTISQPFVVATMTELAALRPTDRVLEVGTGSGYQAAILASLADEVYTIEIVTPLARSAEERLRRLGYKNVHVRAGDGYRGWPEAAPFDAIVVTAAPPAVPPPLQDQLAPGGRLVIPVGDDYQELKVFTRAAAGTGLAERTVFPVTFVPMTGEAARGR
jgi:protein-L-isoaspartate(D-aspartate) O-methyltransferase